MNTWTRIKYLAIVALLGQSLFLQPVQAQENDAAALIAIVHAVAKGWEQADGTPFRKHFLDFEGARYVESGGQNVGLDDLIEHHVVPEGDALDSLELMFSKIETHIEGDFAWAIVDVELTATVTRTDRYIHNRGYETFLFRRVGEDWKVVHTHSSTRAVKKDQQK